MPELSPETQARVDSGQADFVEVFQDLQPILPLYVVWSDRVAEHQAAYIVGNAESCRVVAVIEEKNGETTTYRGDTFRIKTRLEQPEETSDFGDLCRQVLTEAATEQTSLALIARWLGDLYLEAGMAPQYGAVVRECNRPPAGLTWADAVDSGDRGSTYSPHGDHNPLTLVEQALMNEEGEVFDITWDVACHMSAQAVSLSEGYNELIVYRSRFHNYPRLSASGTQTDIVLTQQLVPSPERWFAYHIAQGEEVSKANVHRFMCLDYCVPAAEVPLFIMDAISKRLAGLGIESEPTTNQALPAELALELVADPAYEQLVG